MTQQLKEPKRISCIFEEAKELVKMGFKHLDRTVGVNIPCNIGPLIHTLTQMKNIFGTCKVKTDSLVSSGAFSKILPINFAVMEDYWLGKQFGVLQEEYLSVQLPQKYLDHFIRHQHTGRPGITIIRKFNISS
jgi:hypothetical protein